MIRAVLLFKICVTILFWAVPLTFFPPELFSLLGVPIAGSYVFVRLLGIAYFALTAGYAWGVRQLDAGNPVTGIVLMGIVSNGGSLAAIILFRLFGAFTAWGIVGRIYMMASCAALFSITALLTASLFKKEPAQRS
jgi:hypothetical protein